MSMREVLGRSGCGFGVASGSWQCVGDSIVLVERGSVDYCCLRRSMMLPRSRAYTGVVGSRMDAIWASWGRQMHKKALK